MKRIVLISCVSRKGKEKAMAKDLYKGPLFKNSLEYARALNPDNIFILSALHKVLELEEVIEPYDVTLSYIKPSDKIKKPKLKVLTKQEAKEWGEEVIKHLEQVADLKNDTFIFLAGQDYVKPIKHKLLKIEEPLKGVIQGKRPGELKKLIEILNGD
ncbi:MAG TPA: hypothetical protein VI757_13010 [Bacteroidia bacterium]|nr:hypothetical protein [Bacteroidia bacterium]